MRLHGIRLAAIVAVGACSAVIAAAASPTVTVTDAWARATPPGAMAGALYLTLQAQGTADRLIGVQTPAAGMAMLHETSQSGGVMQMRDVAAVDLPPGRAVSLVPGGRHVMLMDLARPLQAGEHFPATLTFAASPPQTVDVVVAPLGATQPPR